MPIILNIGSNIGSPIDNLKKCVSLINNRFSITSQSRVYRSNPVDYLDQPNFYNQGLQLNTPKESPIETLEEFKKIEKIIGREKIIDKGPRLIDIDIIFWDFLEYQSSELIIPHPSWSKRSFVVFPTKELPFYNEIKNHFFHKETLIGGAVPV